MGEAFGIVGNTEKPYKETQTEKDQAGVLIEHFVHPNLDNHEMSDFFSNPEDTPTPILNKLKKISQHEERMNRLLYILNKEGEPLSSFKVIDDASADAVVTLLDQIDSQDEKTLIQELRTYF